MPITVLQGLPGSGKSTYLIELVNTAVKSGQSVQTCLCSDFPWPSSHEALWIHRRLVSRKPGVTCRLTHFISNNEFSKLLHETEPGTLVAVDESYAFGPGIAQDWIDASRRGIELVLSIPSYDHMKALQEYEYKEKKFGLTCQRCQKRDATKVITPAEGPATLSLCAPCFAELDKEARPRIVQALRKTDPFPGQDGLYQPVELPELAGWRMARPDCKARADIMTETVRELGMSISGNFNELSYLDIGCNTGFFCDHFAKLGFESKGVDATAEFIAVAKLLDSFIRKEKRVSKKFVNYERANAYEYLHDTQQDLVDVSSAFAVFQWVMVQRSVEHGIECLEWLFAKSRKLCFVEMGYTKEDMYKNQLKANIDRDWVFRIMKEKGGFSDIRLKEGGKNGLQRDLFIGVKSHPTAAKKSANVSITASPNPIPAGKGLNSSLISWSTNEVDAEIYVSVNNGPEKLFASGGGGAREADWINPGAIYSFRLYRGKAHKELLDSVMVRKDMV